MILMGNCRPRKGVVGGGTFAPRIPGFQNSRIPVPRASPPSLSQLSPKIRNAATSIPGMGFSVAATLRKGGAAVREEVWRFIRNTEFDTPLAFRGNVALLRQNSGNSASPHPRLSRSQRECSVPPGDPACTPAASGTAGRMSRQTRQYR